MKIVDVAEFYAEQGGGVRTYINQKLEAGAAAGHEVVIIAPGPEDAEEERLGGRILWVKGPPLPPDPRYYVLWNEAKVHRLLDQERPDVLEGSSPWSGGWFAARWKGEAARTFIFHQDPVAVYPQTFLGGAFGAQRVDRLFGWYWAYLRSLSGRYDATVVSGHWLADRLRGFGLQRPEAVPFGIDKAQFSPERGTTEMRQRLLNACGLDGDARLLVTVSRFHPEKRLGTLLSAFERASAKQPIGLVIYGDGPLRGMIRRRASRIPGVHVAGFTRDRDELSTVLASADAMLHGSAAETYGLVVAEAICSGLPVIAPDVGGAADLAASEYAETYRPGDALGCALAIERLLDRDRDELRAACVESGTQRIGTMDDHFQGLFRFYEQLVTERRG
ncbi:MAG: glycosyltransferase [Myxococcota bacterium]|nr:glycosyltransferase [Myxococcota bacterium]